jgi:hypothetical protein
MTDVKSDDYALALVRYAQAFENLTPSSMPDFLALCCEDVHFQDPFQKVRGKAALAEIFWHMFYICESPRFVIHHQAIQSSIGYLHWTMTFRMKKQDYIFNGVTQVHFAADHRVAAHLDFWDPASQLYVRLPVLGALMRFLQQQLATPPGKNFAAKVQKK